MVGKTGLEPVTPRLSSVCSNQLSYMPGNSGGGAEEIRTPDILLAKQALYQLSYSPAGWATVLVAVCLVRCRGKNAYTIFKRTEASSKN